LGGRSADRWVAEPGDKCQDRAALLIEALKGPQIDDYFQVRQTATKALGLPGPGAKAAAPAFREALKD
jgi:hypothetical protein